MPTIITAAILGLLLSLPVRAESQKMLCDGFLPENNLRFGIESQGGLSEEKFHQVLDEVQSVYGPVITSLGGTLVINRLWKDDTVNASAMRKGASYVVNMFGGLARHPDMTPEGFATVACHELGHHIGGIPKGLLIRMSVEGQSDYFATTKCMRKLLSRPAFASASAASASEQALAQKACEKSFSDAAEQNICVRGALAGVTLANVLRMGRNIPEPSISTPDSKKRWLWTDGSHPHPQCRLDTYFQGALCKKSDTEDFKGSDHRAGACTRVDGFEAGARPRCWYHPPRAERKASPFAPEFDFEEFQSNPTIEPLKEGEVWKGI